jgi:hypothetical protein
MARATASTMEVPVLLVPAERAPAVVHLVSEWSRTNGFEFENQGDVISLTKGGGVRLLRKISALVSKSEPELELEVHAVVLGAPNINTSVDHRGFVPYVQKGAVQSLREERDRLVGVILREIQQARLTSRMLPTLGLTKGSIAAFLIAFFIMFILSFFIAYSMFKKS